MTSTQDADAGAGRGSGFAGIQALQSREPGYSVAREALAVQHAAEQVNPTLRTEHGTRLHPDAWSWYVGALGEIEVGGILSKLGPEWLVRHAVPIGTGATDVDHLLVGPNGVFALNTKRHRGASVWVGERAMKVNARFVDHLKAANSEAKQVSQRLEKQVGFWVPVHSAIVVVGQRSLTDVRHRSDRRPDVVPSSGLLEWILRQQTNLSATSLGLIRLAAEEPDTWHVDPGTADTFRVMQRFERLRAEVGDNPPAPSHDSSVPDGAASRSPRQPRARSQRKRPRQTASPLESARSQRTARGMPRNPTGRAVSKIERVIKALVVWLVLVPALTVVGLILLGEIIGLYLNSR